VTGGSYGGGERWLQASQAEWTFPRDCSDPNATMRPPDCQPPVPFNHALPILQLQVAVPKYPWTDLAYSLAPNGHPGGVSTNQSPLPPGYCDVDQTLADDPCYSSSQGDPNSDTGSGNPFGVVKESYTGLFFGYGHGVSNGTGFQVEDSCDTPPAPASVDSWSAFADGAGEPYDTAGVETPLAMQVRHGLTECRSSYYQDEGWKAQATGSRRVAIFSIQGWTDDLFTPVESFRQFKYLKGLDPLWPVAVALADVGHPRAKNNPDTWHFLNDQAWQFLQSQINGSHDQQTNVMSQETVCGQQPTPDPNQTMAGRTPEALSSGSISIPFKTGGATDSAEPDPNGPAERPPDHLRRRPNLARRQRELPRFRRSGTVDGNLAAPHDRAHLHRSGLSDRSLHPGPPRPGRAHRPIGRTGLGGSGGLDHPERIARLHQQLAPGGMPAPGHARDLPDRRPGIRLACRDEPHPDDPHPVLRQSLPVPHRRLDPA